MRRITAISVVVATLSVWVPVGAQEMPEWQVSVETKLSKASGAESARGDVVSIRFDETKTHSVQDTLSFLRRMESVYPRLRVRELAARCTPRSAKEAMTIETLAFGEGSDSPALDSLETTSRKIHDAFSKMGVAPSVGVRIGTGGVTLEIDHHPEFSTNEALRATLRLADSLQGSLRKIDYEEGQRLSAVISRGVPQTSEPLVPKIYEMCRTFRIADKVTINPVKEGARIIFKRKEGYQFRDLARIVRIAESQNPGVKLVQVDFGKKDEGFDNNVWRPRSMTFAQRPEMRSLEPILRGLAARMADRNATSSITRLQISTKRVAFELVAKDLPSREAAIDALKKLCGSDAYQVGTLSTLQNNWVVEKNASITLNR